MPPSQLWFDLIGRPDLSCSIQGPPVGTGVGRRWPERLERISIMALFGKKKQDEGEDLPEEAQVPTFTPQPEKAQTWFNHAKTMADSANFETSLIYYVSGLKLDPSAEEALMDMFRVAVRYGQEGGKRLSGKKARSVSGDEPIDKMATELLIWASDLQNGALAVKAIDAAHQADQDDFATRMAPTAFNCLRSAAKQSKAHYVGLKDACKRIGCWEVTLGAGRMAMQLDPSDSNLEAEIKAAEAELAIAKSNLSQSANEEGGFRSNIKDLDKQRELEEEDSIAGVGGGGERVLARAKAQFEEAPEVAENINRYATLLRREGTAESLKMARSVYMHGFKSSGEYRFKMAAGDIRIQQYQMRLAKIEHKIERDGSTEELESLRVQTTEDLLAFEAAEYGERAEKYPTDRNIKFQLGEVAMRRQDIDTAMGCFQKAKDEPRLRTRAGHALGLCFASEGWFAEAIAEYKDVLSKIDATEGDRELSIRYDLMLSLKQIAERDRSLEHAREALEICSGIARRDITYQDIREQRRALDELVRSL